MTDEEQTYPEQILEELSDDQKRMVLAGKVDTGGHDASAWTHTFAGDERIWQRSTSRPEPHLTPLGLRVYYALIAEKAR